MEYLGNRNLFTTQFTTGSILPSNKSIDTVGFLELWYRTKEDDWGLKQHRLDRTKYVKFLHIIDLDILEILMKDMVRCYKKSYPYGEKKDFVNHTLDTTLHELESFLKGNYTPFNISFELPFIVYFDFHEISFEYLDFVIDSNKDMAYYRQYFKKVVKLIKNIEFDKPKKLINMDIWNILPKGLNEKEWSEKNKDEKIDTWNMIYWIELNSPVMSFLEGLNDRGTDLAKENDTLLNFIKYNKFRFDTFPAVYEDLNNIIKHPRFIKENNIGVFEDLKNAILRLPKVCSNINSLPDSLNESQVETDNNPVKTIIEKEIERIKNELTRHDFFTLDKVKVLTVESQNLLLDKLYHATVDYRVCLLDEIGFFRLLEDSFKTEFAKDINNKVALIFNPKIKSGETIKKSRASLNKRIGKNNANQYTESVETFCQSLTKGE